MKFSKKKNDNTYFPEEGTANAEIKIRSSENSVLPKVLYVKPRLNHYIAMRASPVARNFSLHSTSPSPPPPNQTEGTNVVGIYSHDGNWLLFPRHPHPHPPPPHTPAPFSAITSCRFV